MTARQTHYKILRMDVGAEHMLPWAKAQASRQIKRTPSGLPISFHTSTVIGDVTADIKGYGSLGGDIYVQISLSAQQDVSAYFGFSSAVAKRCFCRNIILAETEAASFSMTRVDDDFGDDGTYTGDWAIVAGGTVLQTGTGSYTRFGFDPFDPDQHIEFIDWPDLIYTSAVRQTPVVAFGGSPIYPGVPSIPGTVFQLFTGLMFSPSVFDGSSNYLQITGSWAETSPTESQANAGPEGQRSAVFSTDGTELASIPRIKENLGTSLEQFDGNLFEPTRTWAGAGWAAIFDDVVPPLGSMLPETITRKPDLTFNVPEDVCYSVTAAPPYFGTDGGEEQWAIDWEAAQAEGLAREHARRKTCSDGMYTYLQNEFLPPEFEYFIKTTAPKSALQARKIPMEIVSRSQTLISDVTVDTLRTTIYQAVVSLKYTLDDGTELAETFTGGVTLEALTHVYDTPEEYAEAITTTFTYDSLPMLAANTTGKGYPFGNPLPQLISTLQIRDRALAPLYHDAGDFPLMMIANGVYNRSSGWRPTDRYETPQYNPKYPLYVPPVTQDNDAVTFTHPQFLLDYVAASKPTETGTPSTNWLSSRLIDGETITLVPLSFVNAEGEDRGMFPFDTDEITQVKIVGYAKTKFSYATGSFSSPTWTSLESEQFFDYETAWGSKNCVCISSKNPYTDTKVAARTQGKNISNTPPDGYTPTAEERLYRAVKNALSSN
jgi:hypothetical protein